MLGNSKTDQFAQHPKLKSSTHQSHVLKGKMDKFHFRAGVQIINKLTQASNNLSIVAHELENLRSNGFNQNEDYTLKTDKKLYENSILAWGSLKKIGDLISKANPKHFNDYFETHQHHYY